MSSLHDPAWQRARNGYHVAMKKRFYMSLFALLACPALAQENVDNLTVDQRAHKLSAEAISRLLTDPSRPGEAENSRIFSAPEGLKMCATTDAYNSSGTYIGRTYWEVTLSADAIEVLDTKDVTGLLSPCYGVDYEPFRDLLQQ